MCALPDTLARRLSAQLLVGRPAPSAVAAVRRLLAVQAQDERGFRLAVRARTRGLVVGDVETALNERSLVVTWLNRGTLHLVCAEDYWWLHGLTAHRGVAGNARRLQQEGVDDRSLARGLEVIAEAVETAPQSRGQLRDRLHRAGVPTAGQALVHVLFAASIKALIVRGPMVDGEHAFVAPQQWIGPPPDTPDALVRLGQRYLEGHAPADADDLATWAGITLSAARVALAGAHGPRATSGTATPKLLGPFDPLLHGWASRELVVGSHRGVVTNNGLFRPIALVDGRAVAIWGLAGGVIRIHPLEPISAASRVALTDEAADVLRFLGLPLTEPVWG